MSVYVCKSGLPNDNHGLNDKRFWSSFKKKSKASLCKLMLMLVLQHDCLTLFLAVWFRPAKYMCDTAKKLPQVWQWGNIVKRETAYSAPSSGDNYELDDVCSAIETTFLTTNWFQSNSAGNSLKDNKLHQFCWMLEAQGTLPVMTSSNRGCKLKQITRENPQKSSSSK